MANHIGTWKKRLRSVRPSPGIRGKGSPKPKIIAVVTAIVAIAPAIRITQQNKTFPQRYSLVSWQKPLQKVKDGYLSRNESRDPKDNPVIASVNFCPKASLHLLHLELTFLYFRSETSFCFLDFFSDLSFQLLDFFSELGFGEAEVSFCAEAQFLDVGFGSGFLHGGQFYQNLDLGFGLGGGKARFL